MKRSFRFAAVLPALFVLAACEASKSSNPLSPSVAGPIAGVQITEPKVLEPAFEFKFKESQQPIRLVVENAVTSGVRTVSYSFEVSSDSDFNNKVYARSGVPQGDGGRTSVTIERLDLGRTYYWRARAEDGANASTYARASFEVLPRAVLNPPAQHSPVSGATTGRRPELIVGSADRNVSIGAVSYEFQISSNVAFTGIVAQGSRGEDGDTTSFAPDGDLTAGTTYFWRVRASDGETTSSWSGAESFRTSTSAPGPGPGPGLGPGNGGSCASSNGDFIAKCIAAKYPEYRRAGVSHNERVSNMEFLRNRMIEAGLCGGLDVAWNLKRGVGPRSIDAIAWRVNGRVEVVDIGVAYDDTGRELDLSWNIVSGPPGYDAYPRPNCQ